MSWYQSRRIQTFVLLVLSLLGILLAFRLAFYSYFVGFNNQYGAEDIRRALYIGTKFDFRLALLVMMPLFVVSAVPKFQLFSFPFVLNLCKVYLVLVSAALIICYIVDFAYYAYLGERMDASILRFFDTPIISATMVWQSYPVIWLTLAVMLLVLLLWHYFAMILVLLNGKVRVRLLSQQVLGFVFAIVVVFVGLVGKLEGIRLTSIAPLRWSEAYFAKDSTIAALGLNPVLFFFDTYKNQARPYDKEIVSAAYPQVRAYLGLSDDADSASLSYRRSLAPKPYAGITLKDQPPNIVLVMLESLGANRLGAYGNPLNPSPKLDAIIKKAHFFPNFYVPSSGTARTVFGKITGIPDVSYGGTTASRNPLFVNQQTVINSLSDYQRFYFLGGGAHWANIRGLLTNNIFDLALYEEGFWKSANVDVWGISDRALLTESHEILKQRDKSKPFFAVIQTAANHRPFTIPEDDSGFVRQDINKAEVIKHGFLNADQYNAVRLLDFNIGYYMNELVANSDYADNTIFLFYGDHNDKSNPAPHLAMDDVLKTGGLHVPFIIYAPGLLKQAKVFNRPMSLIDMMPTAAYLAGVPHTNTTLGRNIYQIEPSHRFIMLHGGDRRNRPHIGLLGEEFYLRMTDQGEHIGLYKLDHVHDTATMKDVQKQHPEKTAEMKSLLMGLYHTARYMMGNNAKLD